MNKFIIKPFLIVFLFLFIYNPPVKFLPLNTGVIIGAVFFVLYLLRLLLKIDLSKQVSMNKDVLRLIILIAAIVMYSFLIAIVSGSGDFQLFRSYLAFLVFYLPGSFGIVQLFKKYFTGIDILKALVLITVLQSIIILGMFVNPVVKAFFFSLLRDADDRIKQNLISHGFRFLGFSFGSSWDLSLIQSVGVMSIALLLKLDKSEISLKNVMFFLIISLSVFLAGRTGIFGIFFALIIIIIPIKKKEIPLYRFLKFGSIFSVITFSLFFLIRSFVPAEVADIVKENVLPWAIEVFKNDNGVVFETKSTNELKTQYFVPAANTFLFGDGYYINPSDPNFYYMDTDGGYMRHILFYGIVGTGLMVVIYLVLFSQMLKFSYGLHKSLAVKIYIFLLGVYFLFAHIKGDLLTANMPVKLICVIYSTLFLFYQSKEYQEIN